MTIPKNWSCSTCKKATSFFPERMRPHDNSNPPTSPSTINGDAQSGATIPIAHRGGTTNPLEEPNNPASSLVNLATSLLRVIATPTDLQRRRSSIDDDRTWTVLMGRILAIIRPWWTILTTCIRGNYLSGIARRIGATITTRLCSERTWFTTPALTATIITSKHVAYSISPAYNISKIDLGNTTSNRRHWTIQYSRPTSTLST